MQQGNEGQVVGRVVLAFPPNIGLVCRWIADGGEAALPQQCEPSNVPISLSRCGAC